VSHVQLDRLFQRAEMRGKGEVLLDAEILRRKRKDRVRGECFADRLQRFGIQRLAEVDVADLCSKVRHHRETEIGMATCTCADPR
jgi:hypothetical protein